MHEQSLQLMIRQKLHGGGPGNGEACDACAGIVTKDEWMIEGISLAGGRKPLQLHAASTSGSSSGTPSSPVPSLTSGPCTTAPMPDEGRPTPDTDPKGPEGSAFTLAGRVTHWELIAYELTIRRRVLRVAASGLLVGGASIMASGHQPPDSGARWVVTHLRFS
jgi:hypothetical protein